MRVFAWFLLCGAVSAQGPTVEVRRVDWLRTTVIDVEAGAVIHRVGDEAMPRSVPLASVLSLESPDAPELAVAERLSRIGAVDLAQRIYILAQELAESGERPNWSMAAALARRLTRCVETGRFEEAVALHARLAAIRPFRNELFLPDGFDCREADEHDRAVRRLHRQLLACLRGQGSPDPRELLNRLRPAFEQPNFGPGFFGTVFAPGDRVVWAFDWAAFTPEQRSMLADEFAAALASVTDRRNQRLAVFTGAGEAQRHPTSGTVPATLDHKLAAESHLRGADVFGSDDFELTLRAAAAVPGPKLLLIVSPRFAERGEVEGLGTDDRVVVADLLRLPRQSVMTTPVRAVAAAKPAMVLETVAGALAPQPAMDAVLAEAPQPWKRRPEPAEVQVSCGKWVAEYRDAASQPWAYSGPRTGRRTAVRIGRRRKNRCNLGIR